MLERNQTKFDINVQDSLWHSLLAVVVTTAGIAVAVWIVAQGIHVFQVMRGGASASARVIEEYDDIREDLDGRRGGLVNVAIYEFVVQDSRFRGSTEGPQGRYSVGETIDIEYNPNNPSQNRAKGDRGELADYFVILLCGGLFSYFAITLPFPVLRRLFAPAAPSSHETAPR